MASNFPSNAVAFITGAASGIGLSTTRQLILDGVHRLALIDISPSSLTSAYESLFPIISSSSSPIEMLLLPTNCVIEEEVALAIQKTVEKFGKIDICFNAAGIGAAFIGTADADTEVVWKILDVNLKGVYYCEKYQLIQMMKQGMRDVCTGLPLQTRGSILNVGSALSTIGAPDLAPYVMAKHGVLGLTRTDSLTYASKGIRINCLCPGWIDTPMTKPVQEAEVMYKAAVAQTPIGRFGRPEEVAFMASFLLSDRASFVTGVPVHVDGGFGNN